MFWRLWLGNGLKWKFSLQIISGLMHRERERELSTSTLPIYEPIDLWTDHAFDFVDLWTHEPIFNLEPLTHKPSTSSVTQSLRTMNRSLTQSLRPRATNPRTDLSLCVILIFCVILIYPRTNEPLISDFFVVVVVVWVVVFWWFFYCVVVENSIFRMLPNTWKYFLKQFSYCNQTLENIFLFRK